MQKRFGSLGMFVGLFLGILLSFIFPDLLLLGAQYKKATNIQLGLPNDYNPKSGSFLNSLMVLPLFIGIAGGIIGLAIFKVTHLSKHKPQEEI